jgi:UDP-N-acetylmuramyl pentapeptide synthase
MNDGASRRTPDFPQLMQTHPFHILAVRADEQDRSVAITVAVTADASRAIFVALSEQLDRHRRNRTESAADVLMLREQQALVERFAPLAAADAHAVVRFSESELRGCLLDLTDYAQRVDGEHFQPAELRERLRVIAEVASAMWDANATAAAAAAAAAGGEPLTHAAP